MSRLRQLWHRLRAIASPNRLDREFHDERELHLQLAAEDFEKQGLDPAEARRRAKVAFGGIDAALERQRDARGLPGLEGLVRDFMYALRGLRRDPGLAIIAVLILAIGIGANTAVLSLVRPVLLKPLPFNEPSSLVWISNTGTSGLSGRTYQVATFEEFRKHAQSFSGWTAYFAFFGYGNDTLMGSGDPERVTIVDVAPEFFELLGVAPEQGRLFLPDEFRPNRPDVVMISHEYWARRFAADPAIVGKHLTISERPALVAGVLPATFNFASVFAPGTRVDFFRPAILDEMRPWGNTLSVIARLKPGVTTEQAQAEIDVAAAAIRTANPSLFRFGARLSPLQEHVSGDMRRPLLVLWGAVGLVLLIVCVNVSNLLLARSTARSKEVAIRLALGAGRRRIFQQLLLEGLVLASLGGALGIPLAYALTTIVRQNTTLAMPLMHQAGVDGFVLLVTAGIALATGLIFSVLPGLRLSRANPQAAISEQSRGSTAGPRHAWVRSSLVVAQLTLACVLLIGTGLLLRSLVSLLDANFGFRPDDAVVLTLKVSRDRTPEQTAAVLLQTLRHVRALPGVDAAGLTDALPLDRNRSWAVGVPGRTYKPGERPNAFAYIVAPGYVPAMGMTLLGGRDIADTDVADTPRVVMISESLARTLYPNEDAVGRRVQILSGEAHTIVGVVGDVRQSRLDEPSAPQFYLPHTQGGGLATDLVIRSRTPPGVLVGRIRQDLAAIDPTLTITEVRALTDLVDRSVSPRRFLLSLLSGFSLFALLLASLGIYGVVSYGVNQRISEIGVRMALGATAGDVRRQVLGGTLKLALVGIIAGLAASLSLGRLIGSLLFGTSATDPATFVWTALMLVAVASLAGYLPAMRASRIGPLRALRG